MRAFITCGTLMEANGHYLELQVGAVLMLGGDYGEWTAFIQRFSKQWTPYVG